MESGSITSKDIIGWVVSVLVSLVPLLIFYLKYRIDKKKSNKKILELEEMLYKQEIELKKQEIVLKEEIITRKDLEIKQLKKENEELKKKLEMMAAKEHRTLSNLIELILEKATKDKRWFFFTCM